MARSTEDMLARHEAQIHARMASLDAERASLAAELDEIADLRQRIGRITDRLGGSAPAGRKTKTRAGKPESGPTPGDAAGRQGRAKPGNAAKPSHLPTMPEMIVAVLQADGSAMTPKQIRDGIADLSWPDVSIDAVGPIVWRLWKRGALVKDGDRYTVAPKPA